MTKVPQRTHHVGNAGIMPGLIFLLHWLAHDRIFDLHP